MRDLRKEPIQTLFLGTDWESREILNALYNYKRFKITVVITNEQYICFTSKNRTDLDFNETKLIEIFNKLGKPFY